MDKDKLLGGIKLDLIHSKAALTVFYASILFSLKTVWTDELKTAGVDGRKLFINVAFFESLDKATALFVLAHEALHIAYRHIDGFLLYNLNVFTEAIERRLWNMAGDYVINRDLLNAGYQVDTRRWLYDPAYDGMTTVEVYRILHKKYKKKPWILGDGDIVFPATGTPEADREYKKLKKHFDKTLVKAAIVAQRTASTRDWGNMPGEIERLLQDVLHPKLDFITLLANHMTRYAKDDYSFRRPNRKFWPDFYLPSAFSERVCDLALIFDVSGSVDDPTASMYQQAVHVISSVLRPEKMLLLQFDTEMIGEPKEITQDADISHLKWHGGGGTHISPATDWILENKPEVTLIFTDGCFRKDNRPFDTDVIWIVHNNPHFTANYGTTIHHEV